jgi:hypothetical protein
MKNIFDAFYDDRHKMHQKHQKIFINKIKNIRFNIQYPKSKIQYPILKI